MFAIDAEWWHWRILNKFSLNVIKFHPSHPFTFSSIYWQILTIHFKRVQIKKNLTNVWHTLESEIKIKVKSIAGEVRGQNSRYSIIYLLKWCFREKESDVGVSVVWVWWLVGLGVLGFFYPTTPLPVL